MSIVFFCPGCGKEMQTPDEMAGRKGRCPSCKTKVRIPPATAVGQLAVAQAIDEQNQPIQTSPAAKPTASAKQTAGDPRWRGGGTQGSTPSTDARISFQCPSCNTEVRVRAAAAGKRGKCPHCQTVVTIPSKSTPQATTSQPLTSTPGLTPIAEPARQQPIDSAGLTPLANSPGLTALGPSEGLMSMASDDPLNLGPSLSTPLALPATPPNPYAAPTSYPAKPSRGGLTVGSIVGDTWRLLIANLGTCVIMGLACFGAAIGVGILMQGLQYAFGAIIISVGPNMGRGAVMGCFVAFLILQMTMQIAFQSWIQACMTNLALRISEGGSPSAGVVFAGGKYTGQVFLVNLLMALMITPLVVVAGVVIYVTQESPPVLIATYTVLMLAVWALWILLSLAPFYIVGDQKRVGEAIGHSMQGASRVFVSYAVALFVVGLAVVAFCIVTCMVGLLLCMMALPITQAIVYQGVRRRSAR